MLAIPRLARDAWAGALDLVFAPVCVSCRAPVPTSLADRVVCQVCWARCRPLPAPRCDRCWGPVPIAEYLAAGGYDRRLHRTRGVLRGTVERFAFEFPERYEI
jgi:hypothetical protein